MAAVEIRRSPGVYWPDLYAVDLWQWDVTMRPTRPDAIAQLHGTTAGLPWFAVVQGDRVKTAPRQYAWTWARLIDVDLGAFARFAVNPGARDGMATASHAAESPDIAAGIAAALADIHAAVAYMRAITLVAPHITALGSTPDDIGALDIDAQVTIAAFVYRAAQLERLNEREWVADVLGLPERTAARRIESARARGLLDPVLDGRAKEPPTTTTTTTRGKR